MYNQTLRVLGDSAFEIEVNVTEQRHQQGLMQSAVDIDQARGIPVGAELVGRWCGELRRGMKPVQHLSRTLTQYAESR